MPRLSVKDYSHDELVDELIRCFDEEVDDRYATLLESEFERRIKEIIDFNGIAYGVNRSFYYGEDTQPSHIVLLSLRYGHKARRAMLKSDHDFYSDAFPTEKLSMLHDGQIGHQHLSEEERQSLLSCVRSKAEQRLIDEMKKLERGEIGWQELREGLRGLKDVPRSHGEHRSQCARNLGLDGKRSKKEPEWELFLELFENAFDGIPDCDRALDKIKGLRDTSNGQKDLSEEDKDLLSSLIDSKQEEDVESAVDLFRPDWSLLRRYEKDNFEGWLSKIVKEVLEYHMRYSSPSDTTQHPSGNVQQLPMNDIGNPPGNSDGLDEELPPLESDDLKFLCNLILTLSKESRSESEKNVGHGEFSDEDRERAIRRVVQGISRIIDREMGAFTNEKYALAIKHVYLKPYPADTEPQDKSSRITAFHESMGDGVKRSTIRRWLRKGRKQFAKIVEAGDYDDANIELLELIVELS